MQNWEEKKTNDTQMNCVHDNNINCWLLVEFFKMEIDNEGKRQAKTKALKCETNSNEMKISFCFAFFFSFILFCVNSCACVSYEHLACHMYRMPWHTWLQCNYFTLRSNQHSKLQSKRSFHIKKFKRLAKPSGSKHFQNKWKATSKRANEWKTKKKKKTQKL